MSNVLRTRNVTHSQAECTYSPYVNSAPEVRLLDKKVHHLPVPPEEKRRTTNSSNPLHFDQIH